MVVFVSPPLSIVLNDYQPMFFCYAEKSSQLLPIARNPALLLLARL
jgi:hypothetical protein